MEEMKEGRRVTMGALLPLHVAPSSDLSTSPPAAWLETLEGSALPSNPKCSATALTSYTYSYQPYTLLLSHI